MYVVIISFLGMELAKTRRTGNRARKNNVLFIIIAFSLQRNAHLYEPNCAKFLRENLAKFAFRGVFFDTFHWINLIGAF